MTVTQQQRHQLLTWFEEQMGQDLGASMMELLPPADSSQLATKADLLATKADLSAEIATGITSVRHELTELRAEVKDDLLQVQRTFVTWLIASQAAVITAVGVAAGAVIGLS